KRDDDRFDVMSIDELEVFTFIGVYDSEQREKQRIVVNVEMEIPSIDHAARQDDLVLTIDWDAVCECIRRVADDHPRKLVDTLAHDIAKALLDAFPVISATVQARKSICKDAKSLSIRIKRSQMR